VVTHGNEYQRRRGGLVPYGVMAAPNIAMGTVPPELLPQNMGWLRAQPRTIAGGYIRYLDPAPPGGIGGTYSLLVPMRAGVHEVRYSIWRMTDAPTFGTFYAYINDPDGVRIVGYDNSKKEMSNGTYALTVAAEGWKVFSMHVYPIGGTAEFTFHLSLIEDYPAVYA